MLPPIRCHQPLRRGAQQWTVGVPRQPDVVREAGRIQRDGVGSIGEGGEGGGGDEWYVCGGEEGYCNCWWSGGVCSGGVLAGVGNRGLAELPRVGIAESEELLAGGRREGGGVRLLHEALRRGVLRRQLRR